MTKRDQRELRLLLEHGDIGGFVTALEPLCHKEVRRTACNGLEYDDLMQEARIAALKVARNWSPDRGANPLTLAVTFIRRELWRVANAQTTHKRLANVRPLRLDGPANSANPAGATLGQLTPVLGPSVAETAEHSDELRHMISRLSELPESVRSRMGRDRSIAGKVAALVAAGGQPSTTAVYIAFRTGQTPRSVMLMAERRKRGHVAVRAVKRRRLDGREIAPQGRPPHNERRGELVWRIDMLGLQSEARLAA